MPEAQSTIATPTSSTDIGALASELRVVLGQLTRRMREQTDVGDLTRSQVSALGHLEREGPLTATALAKAQGVRPQSMGAIVAALEAVGFVVRQPDPRDGRKTLLRVSESAAEMYTTGRLAKEDWLGQAIPTTLSPGEVEQLAASLDLLRKLSRA